MSRLQYARSTTNCPSKTTSTTPTTQSSIKSSSSPPNKKTTITTPAHYKVQKSTKMMKTYRVWHKNWEIRCPCTVSINKNLKKSSIKATQKCKKKKSKQRKVASQDQLRRKLTPVKKCSATAKKPNASSYTATASDSTKSAMDATALAATISKPTHRKEIMLSWHSWTEILTPSVKR